jgi:hypothetical protein
VINTYTYRVYYKDDLETCIGDFQDPLKTVSFAKNASLEKDVVVLKVNREFDSNIVMRGNKYTAKGIVDVNFYPKPIGLVRNRNIQRRDFITSPHNSYNYPNNTNGLFSHIWLNTGALIRLAIVCILFYGFIQAIPLNTLTIMSPTGQVTDVGLVLKTNADAAIKFGRAMIQYAITVLNSKGVI